MYEGRFLFIAAGRLAILALMVEYQHISHGFSPVFDDRCTVLVLGSFPSVLSRKNDFYYGNPQNRFWRVLAHIAKAEVPGSIPEKQQMLLSCGIALWDVIQECDIKGSSDASIKNVVPVQIERIVRTAPIKRVVCNGATAGRLYKKYLLYKVGIEAEILPSTSPANASWGTERLVKRWSEALAGIAPASDEEARAFRAAQKKARHGEVEYAQVRIPAPEASSYAVHKSMQGNKRKDTKPELLVRKRLCEAGLGGYRLQWKVPGRPDIAWPGKKVAVFVNGCYWHRCPHCQLSLPKKNTEYWVAKFNRNQERDAENYKALAAEGWKVHILWECELKKAKRGETFANLLPQLAEELGKTLQEKMGPTGQAGD